MDISDLSTPSRIEQPLRLETIASLHLLPLHLIPLLSLLLSLLLLSHSLQFFLRIDLEVRVFLELLLLALLVVLEIGAGGKGDVSDVVAAVAAVLDVGGPECSTDVAAEVEQHGSDGDEVEHHRGSAESGVLGLALRGPLLNLARSPTLELKVSAVVRRSGLQTVVAQEEGRTDNRDKVEGQSEDVANDVLRRELANGARLELAEHLAARPGLDSAVGLNEARLALVHKDGVEEVVRDVGQEERLARPHDDDVALGEHEGHGGNHGQRTRKEGEEGDLRQVEEEEAAEQDREGDAGRFGQGREEGEEEVGVWESAFVKFISCESKRTSKEVHDTTDGVEPRSASHTLLRNVDDALDVLLRLGRELAALLLQSLAAVGDLVARSLSSALPRARRRRVAVDTRASGGAPLIGRQEGDLFRVLARHVGMCACDVDLRERENVTGWKCKTGVLYRTAAQ